MSNVKFKEIAKFIAGQSPKSQYYSLIEGTPFMQGNRTFGNRYPDIDTYTTKITKIANKEDILISVRAPVGDLNLAPCDMCIGRGLGAIRANNGDNKFLYYALKYNINNLIKQGNGTTFNSITKDIINEFELIIPNSNSERSRIGQLLSTIDDKIENNNKMNEELESMAKTIYDYWFLQFEFPNEEGKPYKSSGGKMVWNEELKRKIPEGWGKGYLRDILNLHTDTISKKQIKKTDLYTPIDCLPKKKMCFYDQALIEEAQSSLIKYRKRDILLGAMRVYFHRVCIAPSDGITRTTTFVLRPKHDKNLGFSYQTINRNDSIDYATKNSIGTQQPYAVWENNFEDFYFAMPPLELMIKYSEQVENSIKLIIKNTKEIKELISLRDFILPLLMNGQIGLRELALVED